MDKKLFESIRNDLRKRTVRKPTLEEAFEKALKDPLGVDPPPEPPTPEEIREMERDLERFIDEGAPEYDEWI